MNQRANSNWPYSRTEVANRLKIAFVTLILPGFPGKSGGEIRDAHMLGYLSSHHDVDVFSINNFPDDPRFQPVLSQLNELYYPEKTNQESPQYIKGYAEIGSWGRLKRKLAQKGIYVPNGKYPVESEGFMSTYYAFTHELLQAKVREGGYELLFVTPQVNPVFVSDLEIPKTCKTIFATYDVEKVRFRRLRKTLRALATKLTFGFEERKAIRMERDIVSKVDGVIAVSELDRDTFIQAYGVKPHAVLSVENGVDTTYFTSQPAEGNGNTNIVYVGNMGYPPNSQAVEYFVKEVIPILMPKIPNLVFWGVGANASPKLMALDNGDTIRVTGEVPDVRDYLDLADVITIPLLTGSGTKYKLLEALSAEKPVISTSIGVEGLNVKDGEHLLVRDDPAGIADAVEYCLNNRTTVEEMAKRGRHYVEHHHEWKVVLPKMDEWFKKL